MGVGEGGCSAWEVSQCWRGDCLCCSACGCFPELGLRLSHKDDGPGGDVVSWLSLGANFLGCTEGVMILTQSLLRL